MSRGCCLLALSAALLLAACPRGEQPRSASPLLAKPVARSLPASSAKPAARSVPAPSAPASRPLSYPSYQIFASAAEAMSEVMQLAPRVLGFGEYHQKTGDAKVQSPLKRFTRDILGGLAVQVSDLIVELALPEGDCGGKADETATRVEKETQRPEATENEAVTLLLRAKRYGIRPSVLNMSCKEYEEILGGTGKGKEVDYVKLLALITTKLVAKAKAALARPIRLDEESGELRGVVVLYGGALHNDIYPEPELAAYSYAKPLCELTKDRYVEVDLYVPEYVAGDAELSKQRWYPLFQQHASKDNVVLIRRGPRSFILILQQAATPR